MGDSAILRDTQCRRMGRPGQTIFPLRNWSAGPSQQIMEDGRPFTSQYNPQTGRYEFSHPPRLVPVNRPINLMRQRAVGRRIVLIPTFIPIFGWIVPILVGLDMPGSGKLMSIFTNGEIEEFHEKERHLARIICLVLVIFMIIVVCVVTTCVVYLWKGGY